MTIYPFPLRAIFAYLISYAFISYYPVIWLLDKKTLFPLSDIPFAVCLISLLLLALSAKILKLGLCRYESNSN